MCDCDEKIEQEKILDNMQDCILHLLGRPNCSYCQHLELDYKEEVYCPRSTHKLSNQDFSTFSLCLGTKKLENYKEHVFCLEFKSKVTKKE